MSYIVRVVGYNAYWTGDTEPGKCWSTNITDSQLFDTTEEAQVIVDSGNNMEVVEYDVASSDVQKDLFDWDELDRRAEELRAANTKEEIYELSSNDFETTSNQIHDVSVEVLD
jgi:hypothetical protein